MTGAGKSFSFKIFNNVKNEKFSYIKFTFIHFLFPSMKLVRKESFAYAYKINMISGKLYLIGDVF